MGRSEQQVKDIEGRVEAAADTGGYRVRFTHCCLYIPLLPGVLAIAVISAGIGASLVAVMAGTKDIVISNFGMEAFVTTIVVGAITIFTGILLGAGAHFRKVRMMVPWMVEDALVITTSVSLGIYLFVVFPRAFAVIAMAVLAVAGFLLYLFDVVYSHYQNVEYEDRVARVTSKGPKKPNMSVMRW